MEAGASGLHCAAGATQRGEPGISFRGSIDNKYNARLGYISLPLLSQISLPTLENSPYVEIGPRVDWLVTRKNYDDASTYYADVINDYNRFVFGGSLGVGIELQIFESLLTNIGARTNFDFTNSYSEAWHYARNFSKEIFLFLSD